MSFVIIVFHVIHIVSYSINQQTPLCDLHYLDCTDRQGPECTTLQDRAYQEASLIFKTALSPCSDLTVISWQCKDKMVIILLPRHSFEYRQILRNLVYLEPVFYLIPS